MFVTFEGLDGSGKTTQAGLLREYLSGLGREVVAAREPGGTELGERIRTLLLGDLPMTPWAEAALFAAARAELAQQVITPALDRGADVILDRYLDSSLVYQGVARGLGIEKVLELNLAVTDELLPDRTFVLIVSPFAAEQRREGETRDRIEAENPRFQAALAAGYQQLAVLFPQRVRMIDGSLGVEEIAEIVRDELRPYV
jgi:dTMP kinase